MKYRHFSVEEREQIQQLLWEKRSVRFIARQLGRSPSSVAREINRNIPPLQRRYAPRLAHERALRKRRCRGRIDRLKNAAIRAYVITHLQAGWSPEQIAGRMRRDGIGRISHEAIYQFVYARVSLASGLLYAHQEDLRPHLRLKRKRRIRKGLRSSQRFRYVRGPSIDVRPPVVALRRRIGDWEGDSVVSRDHRPGLNTLVERATGFVCMTKLAANTGEATAQATIARLARFPRAVRQTLTLDNGPEQSRWRDIERAVHLRCFFAHPYHSWERGSNENANGLIREYFPKRTDFSMIPDDEIRSVEWRLNNRPRKRLDFRTPLEVVRVALQG